MINMHTKFEVS